MEQSAGILVFTFAFGAPQFFLVHPGGPFFAKKDEGVWSIPKGLIDGDESPEAAARREFKEEIGLEAPPLLTELGSIRQKGGKIIHAWAAEADDSFATGLAAADVEANCNRFRMEWPPRSGKQRQFPEVDKGVFFSAAEAKRKILAAQAELIERLEEILGSK